MDVITYEFPNVEPNPYSGLSVWPAYADGAYVGCITEWPDGCQPRIFARPIQEGDYFGDLGPNVWEGPVLPSHAAAVEAFKREYPLKQRPSR